MKPEAFFAHHLPHYTQLRQDIHAHPELCFEEQRTSDVVAEQLKNWGIDFERGWATTGIVAQISGSKSSRTVGLRADMDALPITELGQMSYASVHPGKMHACGHDGHTAMLLAAAHYLSQHRQFSGTAYLLFQPAEEGGGGARVMVEEGLFQRHPMEAVFALHNWPGAPLGHLAVSPGAVMAGTSEYHIQLHGRGGHAALPYLSADPIPAAAELVLALQTIVSRNLKPVEAAVVAISQIHAGEADNVIPNTVSLRGTVRTFSHDTTDVIEQRMRQITNGIAQAHQMTAQIDFHRNYPPTINHVREANFAAETARALFGDNALSVQEPTMGGEDFAYLLENCPGAYVFIGNGEGEHRGPLHGTGPCLLHNASYDFNDQLIPLGARYLVALTERFLREQ